MNNTQSFDVVKTDQGILEALLESKEKGTMIGIHAPVLGTGTYITGIVDIMVSENDTTIITKGYDVTGYFLQTSALKLSEIKSVIPFKSIFINPFLRLQKKSS